MRNEREAVNETEKEGRFSRIFQLLPDAVMVARADDGTVLEINDAFGRLAGYGSDALVGKSALSLFCFLDPDFWNRAWNGLKENNEICGMQTRLMRKDGCIAFVQMSMRRIDFDGVPCNLATIHEISSSGNAEKEQGGSGEALLGMENLLLQDVDIDREDVGRLIDLNALQELMNFFYKATGIAMAICDLNGNVRVATGWQDICTRFHRIHPETLANCKESDTCLTRNIVEGEYALYKCKNGMWDLATPIVIGGKRIANLYLGQFLFDDETPDYDLFRRQAKKYGFNEDEYLAALDRAPRWSRELVENAMEFYTKLAMMVSRLSIVNIRLSRALVEQKKVEAELLLTKYCFDNAGIGIYQTVEQHIFDANDFACRSLGYTVDELRAMSVFDIDPVITMDRMHEIRDMLEATGSVTHQTMHRRRDGTIFPVEITVDQVEFNGKQFGISFVKDITERKRAEDALRESEQKFRVLAETAPTAIVVYQGDRFVYVNPSTVRLFGYSEVELLGMKFWEWAHPECRAVIMERGMARQRGEVPPSRYEQRFVNRNGRVG